MFVVVALGAQAKALGDPRQLHAFATPTLVHFGAVLLVAAILSIPGHTVKSLGLCLLICGLGGLSYAAWVIAMALLQKGYEPDFFDWLWYAVFPIAAYASLLIASAMLRQNPAAALSTVAASSLLLLYVGIHNSWDSATWIATHRQRTAKEGPPSAALEADPPEE